MHAALLDLLLPERCAACGARGEGLCPSCRRAAAALQLPLGDPVRLGPSVIAVAAYRYDGVIAGAIRAVKRPGHHAAAVHLGALLWAQIDAVVGTAATWPRTWMPSTSPRLRQRGADIPRLLAGDRAVGLLRRVRHGSDQTDLGGAQRRALSSDDFRPRHVVPPHVVLVDDVRTTGATARAAASTLQAGGAMRVLVVSLAAVGHSVE
jgi:predicted amidophosphoribosyltransferase